MTNSKASSSAPTMTAISPFLAAPAPPLTGASTMWMPCGLSSRARSTALVSLIVEWMAITVPGLALAASSPTTSRTWASSRTVTLIMSAAATSATLSARVAPPSANGVIASTRTSNTVSPPGQSMSRLAIGAPILPRPMRPSLTSSLFMNNSLRTG